jgi:hypothetical protein
MNFDLRFPIGIMFTLFGGMIAIFGLATSGNDIYTAHSLGLNINLIWGAVMLGFGLLMLLLTWRGRKKNSPPRR